MAEQQPLTTNRRLTLRKSAKLRHRSLIERLFAEGESAYAYPLRMTVHPLSDEQLTANFKDHVPDLIGPIQLLVTVSKKKRRHAVDRVLMRRRVREAFRLNSRALRDSVSALPGVRTVSVAFIYIADKNEDYARVEKAMRKLLSKLSCTFLPQAESSQS